MHCIVALCVATLPIVASFSASHVLHPFATPASCYRRNRPRQTKSDVKRQQSAWRRNIGGRGRGVVRRNAAEEGEGPVNMDDSDDPDDAEIYASLRKRLEELEKSAPVETGNGVQPASTMAETPRTREFTVGDAFKADSGPVSAEDKKRSLAWLTIKSVGVISAALSFGTAALYWLAGEYFVHLGPREYPGSASRNAGIEQTVEGKGRGEAAAPRRTMGGSTSREAFNFEGFPDAGRSDVVPPDF